MEKRSNIMINNAATAAACAAAASSGSAIGCCSSIQSIDSNNKQSRDGSSGGAVAKSGRAPRSSSGKHGKKNHPGGLAEVPKGGRQSSHQRIDHNRSDRGHQSSANSSRRGAFSNSGQVTKAASTGDTKDCYYEDHYEEDYFEGGDELEIGSLLKQGTKKQNSLNYLFFDYEWDGRANNAFGRRGNNHRQSWNGNGSGGGGQQQGSKKTASSNGSFMSKKYNKERFLLGKSQFVVRSGPDYSQYLRDPDLMLDWDLVEQVNFRIGGDSNCCPICLYPPVAAKITRCGHVHCWTCMLNHLALTDQPTKGCPICQEPVSSKDLRSVVLLPSEYIKVGDTIEMHLMRRERNSLFALPVKKYHPNIESRFPSLSQPDNCYSRIVVATPEKIVTKIINREVRELKARQVIWLTEDDPAICFLDVALLQIKDRKAETALRAQLCSGADLKEDFKDTKMPKQLVAKGAKSVFHQSQVFDKAEGRPGEDLQESLSGARPKKPPKQPPAARRNGTFYFYQSAGGQPLFLHTLNLKMLVREYGSFEDCPPTIRGQILEKDGAIMTEELRNKLRYLHHLPLNSTFEVAELEMSPSLVSEETASEFAEELEMRSNRRNRRARQEKRREKKIQVEQDKWWMMGKLFPDGGAKSNIRIESDQDFPSMIGVSASLVDTEPCPKTLWTPSPSSTTRSFAKTLKEGMRRSETFPATGGGAGGSTLQQQQKGLSPPGATVGGDHSDVEPDPEGYVPPPPPRSIGDTLAQAMEEAKERGIGGVANDKKVGKKGKNKKKVLLFSSVSRPMI